MSSVSDDVMRVARLDDEARQVVGALLLIRYCGWHGDPKFQQWFGQARGALAHASSAAHGVLRGESLDLDGLRSELDEALESSDPDGPPFEAEITDHLVFATEVLDFLDALDDTEALTTAFERADELAEAHDDMAKEELPAGHELASVGFLGREANAREADSAVPLDSRAALERSEEFADLYARVIGLSYSDEDAGMADPGVTD
ncbi:hypothetical protein [Streptomyces fagopyri]|uniref:hypothetical protein n=1 Tax=Streptomyces fagopyri TaxID=2662397 RepID=UPI0037116212